MNNNPYYLMSEDISQCFLFFFIFKDAGIITGCQFVLHFALVKFVWLWKYNPNRDIWRISVTFVVLSNSSMWFWLSALFGNVEIEVTEVLHWPLVLILSTHSHITVSCLFCQFPPAIKKPSRVKEDRSC